MKRLIMDLAETTTLSPEELENVGLDVTASRAELKRIGLLCQALGLTESDALDALFLVQLLELRTIRAELDELRQAIVCPDEITSVRVPLADKVKTDGGGSE